MRGGELLDRLHKLKYFSEREASAIMQVVTSTLCYLHKSGVSYYLMINEIILKRERNYTIFCSFFQ